MRILIITQWFQPEPHFKGLDFAKALRDMGHDVEVLTGFPNYPGGTVYPGYHIRARQRETLDGIAVTRGYLYPSHDRSALGRIANYLSFALSTTLLAFTLKRPDVVYVYTPPMTAVLPAVMLRLVRKVPFVPDVQDLWPDTLAATGMVGNSLVLRLVGAWTNFAFRRAARVIVLSKGFQERLAGRGVKAPVAVIPNWAPPEIIRVAAGLPAPDRSDARPFTILFAGNMGKAQGLETVLDAAAMLRGAGVLFLFVGGGVETGTLRDRADALGLDNVEFGGPRRPEAMGEVFARADALLVHLRDDPLFAITVPSKIQAYMAIGKPILAGVRGAAADMVAEARAGVTFEPEQPRALADAVLAMKAMPASDREQLGTAGALFYRQRLAFDIGVAAIVNELTAAAGPKSTRDAP